MRPIALRGVLVATVCAALGLGLSGLSTVGTDRWIATSYQHAQTQPVAWNATQASPAAAVGSTSSVVEPSPKLVVGDEQQWLSTPVVQTEKTLASAPGASGFNLGDRVVFSVAAKDAATPLARVFEVVGIEALVGRDAAPEAAAAAKRLPQVIIAREIETTGKPMTLRLLVSEGSETLPPPQKTL